MSGAAAVDRPFEFVIAGAPKAGTTALHGALATHPDLYLTSVKEPKYYLTGGFRPSRATQRGPGDAHSAREWIWRRDRFLGLFDAAPVGAVRGEATPFYLYDADAVRRLVEDVPDVKVIAVIRDPVDRAYSNWMHLWADGLEPEVDFATAVDLEPARIAAGWAPFWHYRGLGRYGEQLQRLFTLVPREHVLVVRYRDLVREPDRTLDRACEFLGVRTGVVHLVAPDNVKPFVADTTANRALGYAVRTGAAAGAWLPPEAWRVASRPLIAARHRRGGVRPTLSTETRRRVLDGLLDDIGLLEDITGESFDDWRSDVGRGSFQARRENAGSDPAQ